MGIDGGERKILSARVVRTIQSIKEIVKNHSDADIYEALQETNMDPNETTQKLLNQDPFHEVRRKRDKKKDMRLSQNTGYRGSTEARKPIEHVGENTRGSTEARKPIEHLGENIISNPIDHSVPRRGYSRNRVAGRNREFRVVRDNRINKDVGGEVKPPSPKSANSTCEQRNVQVLEKGSNVVNQKSSDGKYSPHQAPRAASQTVSPQVPAPKVNNPEPRSSVLAPTNSVVGVYSSSSDPVHVPSNSKSAANISPIKRELGAVGVRRRTSGNSTVKPSSLQSNSISNSHLVRDGTSSREFSKPFSVNSTSDQPSKTSQPDPVLPSVSSSRPSSSYKYNSRSHQQASGHHKVSQPAKEWKQKSGPKSNANSHGAIGSQTNSISCPTSKDLEIEAAHVRDKMAQVDIHQNQNVFIAENIRVSDSDRSRLTFGSFGADVDSFKTIAFGSLTVKVGENPTTDVSISIPSSVPKSPAMETSACKQVDLVDDQITNSGPASGGSSENLLPDKKDSTSPQNLENYDDIGLTHGNSPSYTRTESQQQQDLAEFASLPVYDPHAGYDIPYYRPVMDESVRSHGVQSPQEALGSHMTSNLPGSSIPMVQQQPQPIPQMYQQLHVSPYTNIMPYRHIMSPVYGPPIPITGYSGNPTYPHPSNGNSFLVMPGGSNSHIGANNVKYGIQQFKPVPTGGPSGFGTFASPSGYAINAPGGVVGGAAGLEESSRLKYKDGSIYGPNPQGETSEMWIRNPREMPNMQSAPYYNMGGQTPHGAYMPPHSGHSSFNVAAAQSSHMQFPGLYHPPPPQAAGMANPHHVGPSTAAVAAPGAQLSAYQQPQISHLNWNANF